MERAGGTFILIKKKKIKIHNNELQFPLMTVNKISFLYEWARLHRIHNLWELKLFSCWF